MNEQQTPILYAAYASNLDPAQMSQRCPHSPERGTGWLVGRRLTFGGEEFGWDGALPTVVEDENESVFVALYELASSDDERIDSFESQAYVRTKVRVHTLYGEALAWVYVLDAYEGGLPSARTIHVLAEAAECAGAPGDYVLGLLSRPCT